MTTNLKIMLALMLACATLSQPARADWFGTTQDKGFGEKITFAGSLAADVSAFLQCDSDTLTIKAVTRERWNDDFSGLPGITIVVSVDGGSKMSIDATADQNMDGKLMVQADDETAIAMAKQMALAKRRIDVGIEINGTMMYSSAHSARGSTVSIARVIKACSTPQ